MSGAVAHVVSVSGGKDSTALYLRAMELGRPFRAVFADTGHESPVVYDYIANLPRVTGGPEIEIVRADFAERMEKRRTWIAEKWPAEGIPQETVERAIALMTPTGKPFLDLCILKGRFPSARARFCTEELKTLPITRQVMRPIHDAGNRICSWQGVRAEESRVRATLPRRQHIVIDRLPVTVWRPLLHWTLADVLDMHRRHGVTLNPLYEQGFERVGCFPCIMASKAEIRRIATLFPEAIDTLEEWEAVVAAASKWGATTFFAPDKTPGEHTRDFDLSMPGIRQVVEWSRTSRGGRQYSLLAQDAGTVCGTWGYCE